MQYNKRYQDAMPITKLRYQSAILSVAVLALLLLRCESTLAEPRLNSKLSHALESALEMRQQGQLKEAALWLQELLAQAPGNIRIKVELAATYTHLEYYHQADKLFNELLATPNVSATVRKNIQVFKSKFYPSNKHASSQTTGNTSKEKNQNIRAAIAEADQLRKNGQCEDALLKYKKAIDNRENNSNQVPHSRLATIDCQISLGRYSEANTAFNSFNSAFPTYKSALKSRIRSRLNSRKRYQHRAFASAQWRIGEDSNVNGPLSIDMIEESDVANEETINSSYQIYKLSAAYRYRPLNKFDIQNASANGYFKLGSLYYQKQYDQNEAQHRDLKYVKLYSSLEWVNYSEWHIKLPFSVHQIHLNNQHLVNYFSIAPSYQYDTSWGAMTAELQLRDKQYVKQADQSKNGMRMGTSISTDINLLPSHLTLSLGVGGHYQQSPDSLSRAYQRFTSFAKIEWYLSENLKSHFKVTKMNDQYQGIDTDLVQADEEDEEEDILYPFRRRDERSYWESGLEFTVLKNVRIGAEITSLNIKSNQSRFNYDRIKTEAYISVYY